MLFEALHHKVFLPDDVVFEQCVGLHLRILDLQLVDLAEEAQDLALLLWAHPLRQQLLQTSGSILKLQKPALQQALKGQTWPLKTRCCRTIFRWFWKQLTGNPTFCFWILFCSAMSVTRFSRATATSWVSALSGGDSGQSESFSLSSLLMLSFLLSARHFLLRLLRSCSQLQKKKKYHW